MSKKDMLGFGFYHFDPRWTTFREFDKLFDKGYVNSLILGMDSYGTTSHAVSKMKEKGGQVWLGAPLFCSRRESMSEYLERVKKYTDKLKEEELFDVVTGFHWDEPLLHRPHTNEDLLEMTRALTGEYGLRMYPVFSGYEVMGRRGNWDDPEGTTILESFATEFLTDVGFDSYGYDFQIPSTVSMQNKLKSVNETYPEIDSTINYYRHYFDTLKKRCMNPDVKIWVYPCAYRTWTWAQTFSDEDYCIAHLKGLKDVLLEQDNPGGIHNYTYKSWGKKSIAMDYFLAEDCPERWNRFEEACKEVYKELEEYSKGE